MIVSLSCLGCLIFEESEPTDGLVTEVFAVENVSSSEAGVTARSIALIRLSDEVNEGGQLVMAVDSLGV